jgi:DNA-binding transcriptional LysR family regulator
MDTLQSMQVFVRVAERQGFAAAARDLSLSTPAVSKHVAALEARVKARLFDRNTRSVSLTEAGRVYLERCLDCLNALEDADASVAELGKAPKGLLRVTAPVELPEPFPSVLNAFMRQHPDVLVDLRLSNHPVDLVEEGIDVALRMAPSLDGRFVARPLAVAQMGLFASPGYLAARGRPKKPADLDAHRGLIFVEPRPIDEFTLVKGRRRVRVKFKPAMLSNNGGALLRAAINGFGIAPAPTFGVHPEVDAGRLELVLPEWEILPSYRMYAVYPHRRFLSPTVRAFVETLRAAYGATTEASGAP